MELKLKVLVALQTLYLCWTNWFSEDSPWSYWANWMCPTCTSTLRKRERLRDMTFLENIINPLTTVVVSSPSLVPSGTTGCDPFHYGSMFQGQCAFKRNGKFAEQGNTAWFAFLLLVLPPICIRLYLSFMETDGVIVDRHGTGSEISPMERFLAQKFMTGWCDRNSKPGTCSTQWIQDARNAEIRNKKELKLMKDIAELTYSTDCLERKLNDRKIKRKSCKETKSCRPVKKIVKKWKENRKLRYRRRALIVKFIVKWIELMTLLEDILNDLTMITWGKRVSGGA